MLNWISVSVYVCQWLRIFPSVLDIRLGLPEYVYICVLQSDSRQIFTSDANQSSDLKLNFESFRPSLPTPPLPTIHPAPLPTLSPLPFLFFHSLCCLFGLSLLRRSTLETLQPCCRSIDSHSLCLSTSLPCISLPCYAYSSSRSYFAHCLHFSVTMPPSVSYSTRLRLLRSVRLNWIRKNWCNRIQTIR